MEIEAGDAGRNADVACVQKLDMRCRLQAAVSCPFEGLTKYNKPPALPEVI